MPEDVGKIPHYQVNAVAAHDVTQGGSDPMDIPPPKLGVAIDKKAFSSNAESLSKCTQQALQVVAFPFRAALFIGSLAVFAGGIIASAAIRLATMGVTAVSAFAGAVAGSIVGFVLGGPIGAQLLGGVVGGLAAIPGLAAWGAGAVARMVLIIPLIIAGVTMSLALGEENYEGYQQTIVLVNSDWMVKNTP